MGPMRPDIAKAFAQFDLDGNGTLEKSELQRAFRAIGFNKVEVRPPMHQNFACGARVCAWSHVCCSDASSSSSSSEMLTSPLLLLLLLLLLHR